MDEYFLSKEDWDTIVELGVGECKDDVVSKKIAAATKSSLTRKCGEISYTFFQRVNDSVSGTIRESIRYRFTRLKTWARRRRKSKVRVFQISRTHSM